MPTDRASRTRTIIVAALVILVVIALVLSAMGLRTPIEPSPVPSPPPSLTSAAFNGRDSQFVDDVHSWQTVEPAIDFTAAALLAFVLLR